MSLEFDKEGQITRIGIENLIPYSLVLELAIRTGFCKRIRKLHPIIFLQMFVFSSSLHRHPTVAEIWRKFVDLTESTIAVNGSLKFLTQGGIKIPS